MVFHRTLVIKRPVLQRDYVIRYEESPSSISIDPHSPLLPELINNLGPVALRWLQRVFSAQKSRIIPEALVGEGKTVSFRIEHSEQLFLRSVISLFLIGIRELVPLPFSA